MTLKANRPSSGSLQALSSLLLLCLLLVPPRTILADEASGVRPLVHADREVWNTVLPENTVLLDDPHAIDRFLVSMDHEPPKWGSIYGHDGAGHDERLFALNRERDRVRSDKAQRERLTFVWTGELSEYDPRRGGFRVAIGPKVLSTHWGLVRFKPDSLPSNLLALPTPSLRPILRERAMRGERIEIEVAMTGRLVPDEAIIYDFAHEEPGRGMIMPVVRVERLDYFLAR